MPNKDTFSIKPISDLLDKYCETGLSIMDPFSNGKRRTKTTVTNDLDNDKESDYHMDALEFMREFGEGEFNVILFDPPYSPRQVSEVYKKLGKSVNMQTTQSSYWGNMKKEIQRLLYTGGVCITCGWNSGGIGKTKGFDIEEILLVPHGGWHNDTIITVERKIQ